MPAANEERASAECRARQPDGAERGPHGQGTITDHRQEFGKEENRGRDPEKGEDDAADEGRANRQQGEAKRGAYARSKFVFCEAREEGSAPSSAFLQRRSARGKPAEAPVAASELVDRGLEGGAIEVRPKHRHKDELGIGRLPQEEIRQPLLAGRADEEVGIGNSGCLEEGLEAFLVEGGGLDLSAKRRLRDARARRRGFPVARHS